MLRIVTDGAADMPREWEKEFDINIVPINIRFGEQVYLQFIDIDNEGFYKLVDETKRIPKTAQPSPHQFTEFYKKVAQAGDTILSMHVTSKLSGTYDSAVAAARELEGQFNVVPFDTATGSAGIGMMCRMARTMDRAGKSFDEIMAKMEAMKAAGNIYLALDTLEYARMSGRVGTMQAALASMLNVKPIAKLQNGVIDIVEKVRTRKASLARLIEMVKENVGDKPIDATIVQARDMESGTFLMEEVKKNFNVRELFITDLSISVAANLGPGTVGVVFFPAE
jgi:DegV family protein with EDD domain